jgi:hypothetical protein
MKLMKNMKKEAGKTKRIEGATATSKTGRGLRRAAEPSSPSLVSSSASSASGIHVEKKASAILTVARHLERRKRLARETVPRIDSFLDFLTQHARVKSGSGYVPYHFRGREALLPIVQQLDAMLASGEPDASLALCGGAQFGKTVLMLNLLAYLVAVRFRNVGYYLPDDDLVAGLVDGKLRPDVLDQIPWLARLLQVGKTLAPTGRAVNRKGAFLCTDGERSALAFMRGLGKIPTSFSMDVVIQDEKDDLPEEHARFLSGRMTASDLRLSLIIGTQRYHGAGQNLAFTEGTQHIGLLTCPGCGVRVNPETAWPGICRLRMGKEKVGDADAPRLTLEGNFSRAGIPTGRHEADEGHETERGRSTELRETTELTEGIRMGESSMTASQAPLISSSEISHPHSVHSVVPRHSVISPSSPSSPPSSSASLASCLPVGISPLGSLPIPYSPGQEFYLGCPDCGAELDRAHPEWHALAPERAAQRRWSYRLSQLLFPDIDLAQIVAAWQLAIRDPAQMNVFCTDRLALPKSSTQTLTPHDLQAARGDYSLGKQDQINGISQIYQMGETGAVRGHLSETAILPKFRNLDNSVNLVLPSVAYGGLDMGDQCWFVARSIETRAPHRARLLWIEPIAAERVRTRVPELFRALQLRALCVDAGPLRDLSRDLAFALNDLGEDAAASTDDAARNIFFSRGGATLPLRWQAASERWENARCLPVEFTQREGQGVRHKVARTQEGRIYPLLAAHRDESIARVIGELTGGGSFENGLLVEGADGVATRAAGARFLLPMATESTRAVLDLYERHLLAGSRQERSADGRTLRYLDKCENHFLLATAYAALAELLAPVVAPTGAGPRLPAFRALGAAHSQARMRTERSVLG